MAESFRYSADAKVFRRKTLTPNQKFILCALIFSDIVASAFAVIYLASSPYSSYLPVLLIVATLFVFFTAIYIGLNPKGPEETFVLPQQEIDPNDCSTVAGTVRTKNNTLIEVQVRVPNVHGFTAISSVINTSSSSDSDCLAEDEMFEFALEAVQLKYPGAHWEGRAQIISDT